jgi:DNA-binding phage protein
LVQRNTQTSKYWQEQFVVDTDDIEYLYNLLLESNQPRALDSLALAMVQRHCQLEELAIRTELQRGALYQPKDSYQMGEQLVFPRLDYAAATVVGRRPGYNPQYGEFSVIQVEFEGDGDVREFVADFAHPHSLNLDEGQSLAEAEGLASPQELYELYQEHIHATLEEALEDNDEFINFRGQWFLKGLLAPIHDGHLNIAEAAIDISNKPLPVDALLKDLDLPTDIPAETQAISLNFALHADERFENVGPKGQILWYLRRLEPPQVFQVPRQLEASQLPFDMDRFDNELRRLVGEIDDEATDPARIQPPISDAETVVVTLNYPHRRVGTLPLTPKTKPFFPEADEHHARITFIDKRSGQQFPGWVVSKSQYVFGLDQWYNQNQLPVGAYVTLIRADDPLTVVVDYQPVRLRREWVRVAVVRDGRLSFQLLKQPMTCEYDDLMVVGVNEWATIDALWSNAGGAQKPLFVLLRQVFPELAKLNPQGAVHAKTLYSAVNVVRRCPPGPIFYELSTRASFVPMGHGYWTYDSSIET